MNIIYYHNADNDGKTSGAIVYNSVKNTDKTLLKGVDYHEYNFEKEYNSWKKDDKVYLVDFSFQKEGEMQKAYEKLKSNFIFIDHHKTAIEQIKDLPIEGLRRVGIAACRLCWEYFYPNIEEPEAVKLIGMYDVWDLNKKVEVFQLGISILDLSPDSENWKTIFKSDKSFIKKICEDGELIQKHVNIQNSNIAKKSKFEVEIDGYKAICINAIKTGSKIFDSVFDDSKHDIMIAYGKLSKYSLWSISFYSKSDDIDVSVIAKKYGGGGHKNASGCEVSTQGLINILGL
jgi:oligoribonuclease NrnB/cAMP/cGMP phosphodiesterase (DHH superfamily)